MVFVSQETGFCVRGCRPLFAAVAFVMLAACGDGMGEETESATASTGETAAGSTAATTTDVSTSSGDASQTGTATAGETDTNTSTDGPTTDGPTTDGPTTSSGNPTDPTGEPSTDGPTTDPTTGPTTEGETETESDTGMDQFFCSADLHSIVNQDYEVVEECASDEACLDAECVPACEAADQSDANFGCMFMAPTPPSYPYAKPPCFAAFVTNSWGHPAVLEVARGGVDLDVSQFGRLVSPGLDPADWPPIPDAGVPEGGAAVLFLSSDPTAVMPENQVPLNCPVTPAVNASTYVPGSGVGAAFEIYSDIPVTAYDILPFGGARSHFPSAELLYPTNVWGTNYLSIMPPRGTHNVPGPLWMQVVGLEDDTTVTLVAKANLQAGGGLMGATAGEPTDFTVHAGEYLQWQIVGAAEATGTIFQSDKPIALFSGNRFMRLQPNPAPGGEAAHQQNSAISALGYDYIGSPYETRRKDLAPEAVDYRIVGVVDGTTLSFDPPIDGAPASLAHGEVVEFATTLPFRVESQGDSHPFIFSQLMDTSNIPGGTRPGATAPGFAPMLGDEEWVMVLPHAQYMDRYVFFTDPTYATTNLVFTRVDPGDGFHPVTVDCLGEIEGWQPVGDSGLFEVATADLMRADIGVNGCENGLHVADSEGPFGLTVWGLDSYSSYAYPAGGNAFALTDVVIVPQ